MVNFHISQSIHIHTITIQTISNASVFQIGSAGMIKSLATMAQPGQSAASKQQPFQITVPPKLPEEDL